MSTQSDALRDLETIWHSFNDNKETNAAYERLKAALASSPAAITVLGTIGGVARLTVTWDGANRPHLDISGFRMDCHGTTPTRGDIARGLLAWAASHVADDRVIRSDADQDAPPAPAGGAVPVVQRTAPERIWLAVSDDPYCAEKAFPGVMEEIGWADHAPLEVSVPYVRADLAAAPAPAVEREAVTDPIGRMVEVFIDCGWCDEYGKADPALNTVLRRAATEVGLLTTPPAEAREPVGDAITPQDVERALAAYCTRGVWPNGYKREVQEDMRSSMYRALRTFATQPRDTPRDSGEN